MIPLLLDAAAGGTPFWWTAIKDVAIPVLGAGLILRWVATEAIAVLKALLTGLQDNTKATVDFTSSQREHTATMVALKAEVTAALSALKGQVAEVERDVEALDDRLRETTGKHIVPPEFRKKEGG